MLLDLGESEGNLLALLRRLWYEQIMNKPAQLALAHRPAAQPGPQLDRRSAERTRGKPILAERTQAHGRATISTFSANEAKFRKRSQSGKRSENNV
jgi:hypothetical protein